MQRGRKPTPLQIRAVTGRKRRRSGHDPGATPPGEMPDPPDCLCEVAMVEWHRVAGKLRDAGLLLAIDRAMLAAYCAAFARWQEAEARLVGAALVIKTKNGNVIQNPLVGAARRAAADMAKLGAEFGMSPSARRAVHMSPPPAPDPAARFFGPAG